MSFDDWKTDFLDRTDFPAALADLLVNITAPVQADATQAEARKTLKQYLDLTVSDTRIATGQMMLAEYAATLDKIEAQYPVDRHILLSIWGMETNFGAIRGDIPVFSALASLAAAGRRRALFEDQLLAAAQMVTDGTATPDQMIGSWAGAMGHTQFMPRSYVNFATSLSGGTPDIWSDDPTDALTSTAAYLAAHGWIKDAPWGVEATWPKPLDLQAAKASAPKPLAEWAGHGVHPIAATTGDHLYRFTLPASADDPAILTTQNYSALLAYNNAAAYAVAVGHLADRIGGGGPFTAQWSPDPRGLTQAEMRDLQAALTVAGFDTQGADGFPGPNTTQAIEAYQAHHNLTADGHPGLALWHRLCGP